MGTRSVHRATNYAIQRLYLQEEAEVAEPRDPPNSASSASSCNFPTNRKKPSEFLDCVQFRAANQGKEQPSRNLEIKTAHGERQIARHAARRISPVAEGIAASTQSTESGMMIRK